MFDHLRQRIEHFLSPTSEASSSGMAGGLMLSSRLLAWEMRHAEVAPEHVLWWLLRVTDSKRELAAAGLAVADAQPALEQWLEGLPAAAVDESPPFGAAIEGVSQRAKAAALAAGYKAIRTDALVAEVAAALPPAFNFARAPLTKAAREIGRLFDAPIAATGNVETGNVALTLEGWDPELRKVLGVMQHLADTQFTDIWWTTPRLLFLSVLFTKKYYEAFKARGVDTKAIIEGLAASGPPVPAWARPRPSTVVPSIAPHVFALMLRAERYAADDASDVRLRHLLAALHDEDDLALFVERLI